MHRDDVEDLLEDAAADFVGDPLRSLDVVVHVDAGELAVLDQVGRMDGFLSHVDLLTNSGQPRRYC